MRPPTLRADVDVHPGRHEEEPERGVRETLLSIIGGMLQGNLDATRRDALVDIQRWLQRNQVHEGTQVTQELTQRINTLGKPMLQWPSQESAPLEQHVGGGGDLRSPQPPTLGYRQRSSATGGTPRAQAATLAGGAFAVTLLMAVAAPAQ